MYFTIKESRQTGTFDTKYGQMIKYSVKLEDKEGAIVECELNQKPETPEPAVDGQIHGYIEDSQYGLKFKKTQPEDGGSNSAAPRSQGSSQPRQSNGGDDTQNQIIRQSSLKVAADLCISQNKTSVDDVINMATLLANWAQTGKVRPVNQVNEDVDLETIPV